MFNHELLVDYASGNCNAQQRSLVEQHLADCAACRKEVMELEKTWWALDTWSLDPRKSGMHPIEPRFNDLCARIEALNEPPVSMHTRLKHALLAGWDRFNWQPNLAATAMIAALLFVPAYTYLSGGLQHGNRVSPDQLRQAESVPAQPVAENIVPVGAQTNATPLPQPQPQRTAGMHRADGLTIQLSEVARTQGGWMPRANVSPVNVSDAVVLRPHAKLTQVSMSEAW